MAATIRYGECDHCGRGPTQLTRIPAQPDEGVAFWDVCTACWDEHIDAQRATERATTEAHRRADHREARA